MERLNTLTLPDRRADDVRYLHMESVVRGRGPDRLKYLDLEGRWILSGRSIPFISSAFDHLHKLNDARVPFREIIDQPLNAIGMVSWQKSSLEVSVPPRSESVSPPLKKKTSWAPISSSVSPRVEVPVPPSPREPVPHRSAGYGQASDKRKLSVSLDRSRSVSPSSAAAAASKVSPVYDKYAAYERKDSVTKFGTDWHGAQHDEGFASGQPSPRPLADDEWEQSPPHRTPALSVDRPRSRSGTRVHDTDYDDALLRESANRSPSSRGDTLPYRTTNYSHESHQRRQYDPSPRSASAASHLSSSAQSDDSALLSPRATRNADELVVMAYHMSKKTRTEAPAVHRRDWTINGSGDAH